MTIFRFLLLLLAGVTFAGVPAVAGKKISVAPMHGKNRTASEKSPIGKLAYALEADDSIVVAPDMPWSQFRGFDRTCAETMAEIDRAVANFKD
jgi:hypothetical protein